MPSLTRSFSNKSSNHGVFI